MKRTILTVTFFLLGILSLAAREYEVKGPGGGIAFKISLPEGFNPDTDCCPMVILMHGIFSSKDFIPIPDLAKGLAKASIASIRFDFNGHGKSEGRLQDMTIERELADSRAIWDYARAGSSSTPASTRQTRRSISVAGASRNWGASTCSQPRNWTFTALHRPMKGRCGSFTARGTASYPCAAVKSMPKLTATAPNS